jgi:general stress protein 26
MDFMEKKASDIQKERTKEIESMANELLKKCDVLTLTSINENGYPRTCAISKLKADIFLEIYFETSKRSEINGKVTHFENNEKASVCYFIGGNSVTLIGNVQIISDVEHKKEFEKLCNINFFKNGINDPKHRILKFHTIEATFWIDGKFRTCKYKMEYIRTAYTT